LIYKKGDKAMERLTYNDSTTWAHAEKDCRVFEDTDEFGNECFSGDLINALASYEDAEEQGLLIKLPCKVGDTVYIHHRAFVDTIVECQVIGFTWWGTDGFCVKANSDEYGYGNVDIAFNKFGESIFLTREAAEQALKGSISE